MKTIKLTFAFILINLLLLSCKSDKCFNSAGKSTSRIFLSDSFKVVNIRGVFNINLIQDTLYRVEGTGGENILSQIEITSEGKTIDLFNNNKCMWLKAYERPQLNIHFKDIEAINVIESAFIFSTDTIYDSFHLLFKARLSEANVIFNSNSVYSYNHMSSGGKFIFSGKTNNLYIGNYYSGLFDASQLKANDVRVENYAVVDCKVWAEKSLAVEIHNRGNILYSGDPVISIDSISSTGKLLPLKK